MQKMQMILILIEDIDNNLLLTPPHNVVILTALSKVNFGSIKTGLAPVDR